MELTLSRNNSLFQFYRLKHFPSGIFFVHTSKNFAQLFSISLIQRTNGTLIFGSRILYKVIYIFASFFIKGITGTYVFEFNAGTYITCHQLFNFGTDLSAYTENLRHTLAAATIHILQVIALFECTRHHLEVINLTNVRLDSCLEYIEANGTIGIGSNLFGLGGNGEWHIVNEGNNITQELHHTTHTHIAQCAYTEYGENATGNKTFADTFTHLVFGK